MRCNRALAWKAEGSKREEGKWASKRSERTSCRIACIARSSRHFVLPSFASKRRKVPGMCQWRIRSDDDERRPPLSLPAPHLLTSYPERITSRDIARPVQDEAASGVVGSSWAHRSPSGMTGDDDADATPGDCGIVAAMPSYSFFANTG